MNWLEILFQNIVFQTVIAGVLVFVACEIIQNFFLTPLQKLNGIIGKIDNKLKLYDGVITVKGVLLRADLNSECSRTLRKLACDLESIYKQFPVKIRKRKISESAKILIRLSNSIGNDKNSSKNTNDIDKIRENLNIKKL